MYGIPYLFLLTVTIFVFILIRRNRERAFRNTVEGIAKLGVAERITAHSTIFMPAVLLEIVLRPELVEEEKPTELKVAWQSESPEMIELQVSPHHKVSFPKYLPMEVLGKMEWHELRPVVAEYEGIWFLTKVEDEVIEKGKTKKIKRLLSPKDFLFTGHLVGVIVKKVRMGEDEEHHYYTPRKGYVISFQVSHGTQVEPGNVLAMMAFPTGKPLSEKPN